jgi:hypothetical protein
MSSIVAGYIELRSAGRTFNEIEFAFPRQRYERLFLAG